MYQKLGNSLGFIALFALRLRLSTGQVVLVLALKATGILVFPSCVFFVRYKVYFGKYGYWKYLQENVSTKKRLTEIVVICLQKLKGERRFRFFL